MPDYSQAKIYKIVCGETEEVYVGSTTLSLDRRLATHLSASKRYAGGKLVRVASVHEILQRDNYAIELIENFPCDSREDLEYREKYYIRTIDCVNKMGRSGIEVSTRDRSAYHKARWSILKENNPEMYQRTVDAARARSKWVTARNRLQKMYDAVQEMNERIDEIRQKTDEKLLELNELMDPGSESDDEE